MRCAGASTWPSSPARSGVPATRAWRSSPARPCACGVFWREHGVDDGTLLIGIHAGSINGSAKRWPAAHWAEVADRLHADYGARVVLTGSQSELPIAEAVTRAMRSRPIVLTGQTSIDELAAVLARCDLVLSGDSGPLHMAVALNRPTISVYGPTDPAISGPYPRPGQTAIVLRTGIGCSPCYNALSTAECPYGNTDCMHHLTVDRMYQAVRRVLGDRTMTPLPIVPAAVGAAVR